MSGVPNLVERAILYDGCDYYHITPNGKYYSYGPDVHRPERWMTFDDVKADVESDGEVLRRLNDEGEWIPV